MKLALYYPWVYLKGGAERTLLNLMRRSKHQWTLFTNHYDAESTFPEFRYLDVRQLRRVSVRRSVVYAGHAALTTLVQRIPIDDYDAFMVTVESIGNLATIRSRKRHTVCLCLTPLRVAFDPVASARFRQKANPVIRFAVDAFAQVDRRLWARYDHVFSISDEVTSRLVQARLVDPKAIQVARPGVDVSRFQSTGRREKFILHSGRIMWTKNIEMAIDAFIALKRTNANARDFKLVIAGMVDRKSQPYLSALRARAAPLGDAVRFVECPSDEELIDLYAHCHATIFTAFNEDWGLVPIESMASEAPVVAINRGGPKESIVPGETGILTEADPMELAEAMGRLIDDSELRNSMGAAGRKRAMEFNWENFVGVIDSYFDGLRLDD